ncbi:hypothetical protein H9P43_009718 [Blastocladiella emersonii ATCC 22665]|nr:hypothetical protein H9P43_009718 [Blastocladiella emersonii ATCC 22665]
MKTVERERKRKRKAFVEDGPLHMSCCSECDRRFSYNRNLALHRNWCEAYHRSQGNTAWTRPEPTAPPAPAPAPAPVPAATKPMNITQQPAIFADLRRRVAAVDPALAGDLYHSSGGLPDLAKSAELSDVDVSVACVDFHALLATLQRAYPDLPAGAAVAFDEYDADADYAVVAITGVYPRPVHVYAATSALTAVAHRSVEVMLNAKFPQLVPMALALKRFAGMGTEEAWFRVLEMQAPAGAGEAPWYQALLDRDAVLEAAERQAKWVDGYLADKLPLE